MLFKLILILLLTISVQCVNHLKTDAYRSEIAKYIGSMIQQETQQETSLTNDVVIVSLERNSNHSISRDISGEILMKNPKNAVFIHNSLDPILPHRVHVASFIIVTTDIENYVRM